MALKQWKQLSSKTIFKNKYWHYNLDKFEIEGGYSGEYHYVHSPGSTVIIPVTNNGKIVLVKQFRYLNQWESIEFPCGGNIPGSVPVENAIRELREETGYTAGKLEKMGLFEPFTGASNELTNVFVATDLTYAPLEKDPTEEFELFEVSLEELNDMINSNRITHGITISAWALSIKYLSKILD